MTMKAESRYCVATSIPVLLDVAKLMRENSDLVYGGWTAVPDTKVQTLQFLPR